MDPDQNLKELRECVQAIMDLEDQRREWRDAIQEPVGNDTIQAARAERLAVLCMSLDLWMSRGGFLPSDWQKLRT